jgi:hypothetical protein
MSFLESLIEILNDGVISSYSYISHKTPILPPRVTIPLIALTLEYVEKSFPCCQSEIAIISFDIHLLLTLEVLLAVTHATYVCPVDTELCQAT